MGRCAVWAGAALALLAFVLIDGLPAAGANVGGATPSASASPDPGAQAFADGYRAYQHHDLATAVEKLAVAARDQEALGDYALFYWGLAERDLGNLDKAAECFARLTQAYPDSVFSDRAALAFAHLQLKLGNPQRSEAAARKLVADEPASALAQQARMVIAQALADEQHPREAYADCQRLRQDYPQGVSDGAARALAYSLLAAHPGLAATGSLEYAMAEAGLLLQEGQRAAALVEIKRARKLSPPSATRAELVWMTAIALRGAPARATREFKRYLAIAPRGPHAAGALNALGHIYWRRNDTKPARVMFDRLVKAFPHSPLAASAMQSIGRTWEDDNKPENALRVYERLIARYPLSAEAEDAHFRSPWMLYMSGHYSAAAHAFRRGLRREVLPADRAKFAYWEGRALERAGKKAAARSIFMRLAKNTKSNYYPALASIRVHAAPPAFAPASAAEPKAVFDGHIPASARFHLSRALILRGLDLPHLESAELQSLVPYTASDAPLGMFLLAEFQSAHAWHNAILLAAHMDRRGTIDPAMAERVRYPRAYWSLLDRAARREKLDPYLLLALTRQESLFDPDARSSSGALGLMQLMGPTAKRVAAARGLDGATNLTDPEDNVRLGSAYLKMLFAMFDGDRFKAVAAYNGGEHAVQHWESLFPGEDDQWVENIGYRQTRHYVKQVIGNLREYRLIYGSHSAGSHTAAPARRPSE